MNRDVKSLLIMGGGIVAAYFLLKNVIGNVAKPFNDAGEWIGGTLYDWLHSDTPSESLYYMTVFSDGKKHAIPSLSVDSAGQFTYAGVDYVMKTDANGYHVALPL